MKRIALLTLFLFPLAAAAQQPLHVGVNAVVGVPQGEFYERLDGALGFGLSAQLLYHIPATPVALGIEGGFLTYGQERIRQQFGSGALGRVDVDVITTNNIGLGHLLLRLQPPAGPFRPYGDAFLGLSYLFTESRIQDVSGQRPEVASSTNFDDLAFSYGLGAGLLVTLVQGVSEEGGRPYQVALDLRARYLVGSEAEYLKRGSIREGADGRPVYDVEHSRTSLLMPQVGVVFRF